MASPCVEETAVLSAPSEILSSLADSVPEVETDLPLECVVLVEVTYWAPVLSGAESVSLTVTASKSKTVWTCCSTDSRTALSSHRRTDALSAVSERL